MTGHLSLVLHAHLPFVRHPEHEKFLEESWLFEAVVETYLPLIQILDGWLHDGVEGRLTLTLSPTLCAMLNDPLLRGRCARHLDGLIELAEKEVHRTHWDKAFHELAWMYRNRAASLRGTLAAYGGDIVGAFRKFQDLGLIEIITTAATHAVLPLFADHPPTLRAQVFTAREEYRRCFGRDPRGFWLPECAYTPALDRVLQEAEVRWFIMDTHGLLHATPRPRCGVFAPVFTPEGVAAFGRDMESAQQVWSRHAGYPGDPRYRDFYRDVGFDLDYDYVKPHLPDAGGPRGFTGIKYHRIASQDGRKEIYQRGEALRAAAEHARHFLDARVAQITAAARAMGRPPMVLSPYDAELFGHWWYEGPEFLDRLVRAAVSEQQAFTLTTPGEYLRQHPSQQVAAPAASSWGEEGHLRVWLNDSNEWIYPHLRHAQEAMTGLARRFPEAEGVTARVLRQAAREVLLAQSSDWPFILRTGTSPDYARGRVREHLSRFLALEKMLTGGRVDERRLSEWEGQDNLFPEVNWRHWA